MIWASVPCVNCTCHFPQKQAANPSLSCFLRMICGVWRLRPVSRKRKMCQNTGRLFHLFQCIPKLSKITGHGWQAKSENDSVLGQRGFQPMLLLYAPTKEDHDS